MQNFLQNDKFLFLWLHCVTFFIQDLNDFLALMFFYKIDFSLKQEMSQTRDEAPKRIGLV